MRRVLVVLAAAALLYALWYREVHLPVRRVDAPPQPLMVEPGTSIGSIGRQLHAMGLVRHPEVFRTLVLLRRTGTRLKAGEYSLEGPLSLSEIVDLLVQGQANRRDVTIPEGKSLEDIALILSTRGLETTTFLEAARNVALIQDLDPEAADLEGYLFPDTYDMPQRADAAATLVARMVARFREVMVPELARLPEGFTLRQVVTLASIVELETARGEERPRIAAVFLNRLKRGMPLQTDPTVIYALRKAGGYDGNIRKKDLSIDSKYNTYRYSGLPPGPIASAGREALLAVLDPAPVRDLYFVSRNDGTHHFSETLAEHERAVDRYQRRRSSRTGRP